MLIARIALMAAAAMSFSSIGEAKTLRWASQGDALTLDPHAQNEHNVTKAQSYKDKEETYAVRNAMGTGAKEPATRVAALISGQVDFVLDAPLQDIARIMGSAELNYSDVKGKNPFADPGRSPT